MIPDLLWNQKVCEMTCLRNVESDRNSAHTNLSDKREFIGSCNQEVPRALSTAETKASAAQDPASLLLALLFSVVASFSYNLYPPGGQGALVALVAVAVPTKGDCLSQRSQQESSGVLQGP